MFHSEDRDGSIEHLKRIGIRTEESNERELNFIDRELKITNQRLGELHQLTSKLGDTQQFLQNELVVTNRSLRHLEEKIRSLGESVQPTAQVESQLENLPLNTPEDVDPPYHLQLEDFPDDSKYLHKVRDLVDHGKPVFACHRRHNKLFYGKVSPASRNKFCRGNKSLRYFGNSLIKVGSMTLSGVEDAAVLTPFEDLMSAAKSHSIAFLEFTEGGGKLEWFFHMNSSPLAMQFLILCTGEEGSTYKDSRIQWNNFVWSVKHYQLNGYSVSGRLPSTTSLPKEEFLNSSRWLLEGFSDGSFKFKWDSDYQVYSSENVCTNDIYCDYFPSGADENSLDNIISECGFAFKC